MNSPVKFFAVFCLLVLECLAAEAFAQSAETAVAAAAEQQLFAVEITVGPTWDVAKAPNEQAYFKEHSANLRRLRDGGHIVMGARYSDKGLIVFSARSADEVRLMMDADPSMAAGTFQFEVHAFNVFYPGLVQAGSGR